MLTWSEDCTFYQYDKEDLSSKLTLLSPIGFEELEVIETSYVNQAIYRWIDPITIKNKIILRDQRNVTFWIFEQQKIICCFSNSESCITYAIQKLSEKTQTNFKKVDVFSYWKQNYLPKLNWFATLTNLEIEVNTTIVNENNLKNINIRELNLRELDTMISSDTVTSLSFSYLNIPFHLDVNSVISFYSTASEKNILDVLTTLTKDLYENYK